MWQDLENPLLLLTSWVHKLLNLGGRKRCRAEWPSMKDEGCFLSKLLGGDQNFMLNYNLTGRNAYLRRLEEWYSNGEIPMKPWDLYCIPQRQKTAHSRYLYLFARAAVQNHTVPGALHPRLMCLQSWFLVRALFLSCRPWYVLTRLFLCVHVREKSLHFFLFL